MAEKNTDGKERRRFGSTGSLESVYPIKGQRTLMSLKKVVRLGTPAVCFTEEEIKLFRTQLLDERQSTHQLLTTLRKLDCYRLEVADLVSTDVGTAVATLATHHPKPDVARLALCLLQKWGSIDKDLKFYPINYNVDLANAAPEGEAQAPEVYIAAEKVRLKTEKLERRRRRLLEDNFLESSSSDSEVEKASKSNEDEEWRPEGKVTTMETLVPPRTRFRRRSKQARQQQMILNFIRKPKTSLVPNQPPCENSVPNNLAEQISEDVVEIIE